MAMARDGLLPSFFSDVSKRTQVPVKSTVVTGLLAGTLAFFMDVDQLAGMVCSSSAQKQYLSRITPFGWGFLTFLRLSLMLTIGPCTVMSSSLDLFLFCFWSFGWIVCESCVQLF